MVLIVDWNFSQRTLEILLIILSGTQLFCTTAIHIEVGNAKKESNWNFIFSNDMLQPCLVNAFQFYFILFWRFYYGNVIWFHLFVKTTWIFWLWLFDLDLVKWVLKIVDSIDRQVEIDKTDLLLEFWLNVLNEYNNDKNLYCASTLFKSNYSSLTFSYNYKSPIGIFLCKLSN